LGEVARLSGLTRYEVGRRLRQKRLAELETIDGVLPLNAAARYVFVRPGALAAEIRDGRLEARPVAGPDRFLVRVEDLRAYALDLEARYEQSQMRREELFVLHVVERYGQEDGERLRRRFRLRRQHLEEGGQR